MSGGVSLGDSHVASYGVAHAWQGAAEGQTHITSMDFHRDGDIFVAAGADASIHVFDVMKNPPQKEKKLMNKETGHNVVRYTHHRQSIVTNSKLKGGNHLPGTLTLWDVFQNTVVRRFAGHGAHINSISLSPRDDHFISASVNGEVRLWDLNSTRCLGKCAVDIAASSSSSSSSSAAAAAAGGGGGHRSCVAFDNQGMVFAIGTGGDDGGMARIFDLRAFDQGPFQTITLDPSRRLGWSGAGLQFSPDGRFLLFLCLRVI